MGSLCPRSRLNDWSRGLGSVALTTRLFSTLVLNRWGLLTRRHSRIPLLFTLEPWCCLPRSSDQAFTYRWRSLPMLHGLNGSRSLFMGAAFQVTPYGPINDHTYFPIPTTDTKQRVYETLWRLINRKFKVVIWLWNTVQLFIFATHPQSWVRAGNFYTPVTDKLRRSIPVEQHNTMQRFWVEDVDV